MGTMNKQTRRSISVTGDTYDKLQAYCRKNKLTGSGVAEQAIRDFLNIIDPVKIPLRGGLYAGRKPDPLDKVTQAIRRTADRIFTF